MAGRIITLTTDFGLSDPYVGLMKGVILGINPQATIVDITHGVRPQEVGQAAFLISKNYSYFPSDAIHVVVVDPGVGTARRALAVVTPLGLFVAPDNGVLGRLGFIDQGGRLADDCKGYHLTQPAFWRYQVSHTFHGRDVFAPVTAHLSLGVSPDRMGEEVSNLTRMPYLEPAWHDNEIRGEVVHIDHYGNLVTDIGEALLGNGDRLLVEAGGESISGLSRSYAEGGELLAIVGSFDTLEVAARNASAEARIGVRMGDTVRVTRHEGKGNEDSVA